MGRQTGAKWVNGFHLIVIVAALACPTGASAQSVVESELTRTTLTSSVDAAGRTVLTASVTAAQGGGIPGGIVRFTDETTLSLLGWADVSQPSIVIDHLRDGQHRFRAAYSGTANFLPVMIQPSQSGVLVQTMRAVPNVSVSSSDNPCASGAVVTLTAAIAVRDGKPTGAVTFRDGERVLAAHIALDRAGTASFTTSALADGSRVIIAEYEGDANHVRALSPQLMQGVGTPRVQSSQLENAD